VAFLAVAVHVGLASCLVAEGAPVPLVLPLPESAAACGSVFAIHRRQAVSDSATTPASVTATVPPDRESLSIGANAHIGFRHVFRGGRRLASAITPTVLRADTLTPSDPEFVTPARTSNRDRDRGVVTAAIGWISPTASRLGRTAFIDATPRSGPQRHAPGRSPIGAHAPRIGDSRGAGRPNSRPLCVVSLGAVLMGRFPRPGCSSAATQPKPFDHCGPADLFLVTRKTRNDIPDESRRRTCR